MLKAVSQEATPNKDNNVRHIITEMTIADLQKLQAGMDKKILIVKFGAEWCGPCKRMAPLFYDFIGKAPPNIIFADIDTDENMDLFMGLKKYKMIQSIPTFLVFYGDVKRNNWFIPDDSIIGADIAQVTQFFLRCQTKAGILLNNLQNDGYSYFT